MKKLHKNAIVPTYQKEGDAGLDLIAVSKHWDVAGYYQYGTGLAVEIPFGYVGLIYPRSSISDYNLMLSNHVGVIDSGYRGEICLRFKYVNLMTVSHKTYKVGDRIGQLLIIPYPSIKFEEVKELSDTNRGKGGFGSSGT